MLFNFPDYKMKRWADPFMRRGGFLLPAGAAAATLAAFGYKISVDKNGGNNDNAPTPLTNNLECPDNSQKKVEEERNSRNNFVPMYLTDSSDSAEPTLMMQNQRPKLTWDRNWDRRDPLETLKGKRDFLAANQSQREEMVSKVTPTAVRNIFLIRHGQYNLEADSRDERKLTPLGREQATLLGKRLIGSKEKFTFDKCVFSTMIRAKETGSLVLKELPYLEEERCRMDPMLEEGAPYPPEPPSPNWRPESSFHKHHARIEAAFRQYFHRASPKQKEPSYELIVCHANVIRYFVCRALQFPPEGWLRISLANSSITWLQISPNGNVSLKALGDFGHLPPDKLSFT